MPFYRHLGKQPSPHLQSPAKVFARLKSKVRQEGVRADNGVAPRNHSPCSVHGNYGGQLRSPRKTTNGALMEGDLPDSRGFGYRDEAKALTISPVPSPKKNFGCWNLRSSLAQDKPLVPGRGREYKPSQGAFLQSAALPQAQFLDNRRQIHEESPRIRDAASGAFSPIKSRLRKRKCEPGDFNNISSSTKSHNDSQSPQNEDIPSADRRGEGCVVMEDLVHGPGFSAVRPDMSDFPQGPIIPLRTQRDCSVLLEKCPVSPAKIFAIMKKREGQAGCQDVHRVCNSKRNLFNRNGFRQSGDTPPPEAVAVTEVENTASTSDAESVFPVCPSIAQTAESPSATDPSIDVPTPVVFSQPVLLSDPLILNSPRVTIPKKNTTLKHNCPQPSKVPSQERVIHLKEWCVKHNKRGLYVEGIHREEDVMWNSNIIAERVSPYVVKTVTGRVYILIGKMKLHVDSIFSRSFLKKFQNGFPPKWSKIYEQFLLESRTKDTERRNGERDNKANSEACINLCLKNQRTVFKTPDACPPSSSSSTKTSRSGRIIKPPLEYWKGGRVILDAQMNVTVHECYEKSFCNPEENTAAASARKSQKSLFLDRQRDKAASPPPTNVKAPSRRRNRGTSNQGEVLSHSPDPPMESLSIPARGSSGWMRPISSCQTTERGLEVEPDPQWNTGKTRGPTRKRTVLPPQASPDRDDASPEQSSDGSLKVRRAKRSNRQYKKRGGDSPQLQHLETSRMEVKRRDRGEKAKNKDISELANVKSSTTSRKPKMHKASAHILAEEDEEKWTEYELAALQEAVALYPKHKADYWAKVARLVGTHSAEECYKQHTFQGTSHSPLKKDKKREKKRREAPTGPDNPVISARAGTFKRKQQVRHFLETMPKENVDDVFSCTYMQNKRFQIPNNLESNLSDDHDITLRSLEPVTPMSTGFPEVKSPQCLPITPGMVGSPSRSNSDKYIFQLQKRMKKKQFDVCKKATSNKNFTPTPSVKRTMRCGDAGQDTFVVREMFPGSESVLFNSEEEEDYYFSDSDCT